MNKIEHDSLTDEIIGEAALSLLQERGPINTQTLIARLRAMEAKESDSQRRMMIAKITAQLTESNPASDNHGQPGNAAEPDRDNVYSIFGNGQKLGASKKH